VCAANLILYSSMTFYQILSKCHRTDAGKEGNQANEGVPLSGQNMEVASVI